MRGTMLHLGVVFLMAAWATTLSAEEKKKAEAPRPQHVTKEALCHRTANPVEVDGVLADWEDVDAREAMVIGEAENVQKPKRYKGPEDAGALVYTKWDDKNLYLAAVVTDDRVRNTHEETELQEGDGLLLCLSPKTPAEFSAPKPDQPALRYPYGFIFTAGDGDRVTPQFITIMNAEKQPLIPPGPWQGEVKRAAKPTKTGYILELSLPFSVMPDLKPAVGRAIGCEVCLYESDTRVGATKRTTILGWCSVKDRMDPTEGGKLTFADANKEKLPNPPGALRAEDLIKNPHQPTVEGYVARKPHDELSAVGVPFGLYFERAQRDDLMHKVKNERMQRLFDRITILCDSYLSTWQPESYFLKDLSPEDAEQVAKVIQRLAFLYTMTEQEEYADLARRTMLRICERSANWSATLESADRLRAAAHLAKGLAIGSDWVHNALDMEERATVEKALTEIGAKLAKGAGTVRLSPADKVIILTAAGICGAATRQRNEAGREWLSAAERAAAEFASSDRNLAATGADDALFSICGLIDPLKKTLGHDLFSMMDLRGAISKRAAALRTKVPSGWALDPLSIQFAGRLHASVLLRQAAENRDGLAMWFYETIFKDMPASSRDADDVYTILCFDDRTKSAAPDWYKDASQAELAQRLEKLVKDACLADAAARERARPELRPTVKEQRRLPVPFSADWLGKFDEKKVLADFEVTVKPALLKQHPRLFFTRDEMPRLYARMASCQAKVWDLLLAGMERNLTTQYRTMKSYREDGSLGTGTGDTLAHIAFVYGLTGDDAQGETLKRLVQGYCAEEIWDPPRPDLVHAHVLAGLSLAYDVGQRCLMPEERLKVRDKLVTEARRMYESACAKRRIRTPGNANNHSWIQKCSLAIAATVIYEHTPDAKEWLNRVRWEYEKILEIHGPDGASCEGTSYWAYGLMWMLRYMELLRHTSGEDMYEYPWLRQTGYYALYCLSPGGALHVNFGDNGEDQGRVSMIPYRLASEFRDPHIQWLGDHLQWGLSLKAKPSGNIWSFMWYDPTVAVKPPDDLPPYRYFDDLEMVIVKSSWKDDARMLAFRCGPPMGYSVFEHGAGGYGHAHPDQNNFIFYAGGGKFIASDPGYSRWKMTSEHNLILVDGKGQIGEEEHWLHYVYKADELAEMEEVFLSPAYAYMRGEAHRAYRRELGVQNCTRQAMFLDGDYLVVLDEIASDAPRQFEWLLHSWDPIAGPVNGTFTLTQDDARLAAAVLVPGRFEQKAEPMMVKSAVKWGLDGKPVYIEDPVQHGYYLSVSPMEKAASAGFLAVFWPYPKDGEKDIPKIALMEGTGFVGAQVDGAKRRDRVVFNLSKARIEADGIGTDAARAGVRLNEAFEPVAYVIHSGKTLTSGACELVKASAPVILQLDLAKAQGTLAASAAADVEVYSARPAKAVRVNGTASPATYDPNSRMLKFRAPQGRSDFSIE